MSSNPLVLTVINDEPRVDSRLIAEQLGVIHKNIRELIERYLSDFEEFGHTRFETACGKRRQGGGTPEKYYLLNEDQSCLLLTYSQNTPQARDLKKRLVRAFSQLRYQALETERRTRLHAEQVIMLLEQQLDARPVRYISHPYLVESLAQGQSLNLEQQERRQRSADLNRKIVEMHRGGMNCSKIAAQLGLTRLGVYSRLERLMKKARQIGQAGAL